MACAGRGPQAVSVHDKPGPADGRARRRRVRRVVLVGVVLVAVPFGWWSTRPEPAGPTVDSVGAPAAEALASGQAPPRPSSPGTPGAPPAPPETVRVPAADIAAPVVPVDVTRDGAMEVPSEVDTVGWYRPGPAPGASGSAVLAGHVDDAAQGPGVFARITEIDPGHRIAVTGSDGGTRWFRVVAREVWPKDEVPLERVFDRDGAPRVVLITCGGVFDRAAGSYEDNIAVTAVPVDRTASGG